MFKDVLVGVDGRPNGRDAIALASRLVDPDGRLTLAHVHSGSLRPSHAIAPHFVREEGEASHKLLERERADADVQARLVSVVALSCGRGLHEQAEEQGADLIVVGSTSHGAFGRAMLGDDTRGALNGTPCAVAVAANGYAKHSGPITKVGVGHDGSPESHAALEVARGIAAAAGASVHALRVVPLPTYAYVGLMSPDIGQAIELMVKEANCSLRESPGRALRRRLRILRRGARGICFRSRSTGGRLSRLRSDEASDARQHLRLPCSPRTRLTARAAASPDDSTT